MTINLNMGLARGEYAFFDDTGNTKISHWRTMTSQNTKIHLQPLVNEDANGIDHNGINAY